MKEGLMACDSPDRTPPPVKTPQVFKMSNSIGPEVHKMYDSSDDLHNAEGVAYQILKVGDRVKIDGAKYDGGYDHVGEVGRIVRSADVNGDYEVKLDNGETTSFPASSMVKVPGCWVGVFACFTRICKGICLLRENVLHKNAVSLVVGVFALPQAMNMCGYINGGILLFVFALLSYFTSSIMISAAEMYNVNTFEEVVQKSLGKWGVAYYAAAMVTTCFIGNASHIQAVGTMFGDLMYWFCTGQPSYSPDDEFHMESYKKASLAGVMLCLVLPFCFENRTIASLKWVGALSVGTVLLNITMMVLYCWILLIDGYEPHSPNDPSQILPPAAPCKWEIGGLFRAAGAIAFAYTPILTSNLFNVLEELRGSEGGDQIVEGGGPQGGVDPAALESQPTEQNEDGGSKAGKVAEVREAVATATAICFFAYLVIGVSGYITFGESTVSNVIYNTLPKDRMLFRLPWMGMIICITLLYPVVNFSMVESLEYLVGCTENSRMIISTAGAFFTVLVLVMVKDIVDLFGLCASLGLGSIVFIIPSLVCLKSDPAEMTSPHKIMASITLFVGTAITIFTTYFVIEHIFAMNSGTSS